MEKIFDRVLAALHLQKYRHFILYVFFGGLTTLTDWGVSFLLYALWGEAIEQQNFLIHGADAIAWAAAVLVAFFTNRVWVFESKRHGFLPILGEFAAFAGSRVVTLLLQEGFVAVLFDWLGFNKYAVKIIAAVVVVIVNYFIGKYLVFRKKTEESGPEAQSHE
ncbi:MAG: GtrA family protein [Ruminococcus sp.]|nr:GtrA family protein [Candidatus Apopatosoma intestinale]